MNEKSFIDLFVSFIHAFIHSSKHIFLTKQKDLYFMFFVFLKNLNEVSNYHNRIKKSIKNNNIKMLYIK